MVAGPSRSLLRPPVTPHLNATFFDEKLCHAPPKENVKRKIELCKTLLPVVESPMSSPPNERGPSMDTPLVQSTEPEFRASYQIQKTKLYENVSEMRYTGSMVCGRSVEGIKRERVALYMERSTPGNEPEYITRLRREAYENGLTGGFFLFLAPAVSQAAACDGSLITTTADRQEIMPGTLPIFQTKFNELLTKLTLILCRTP